jgi:Heat induced stress protein YflT domain
MTVTITHLYDNYTGAENAVRELEGSGFTSDQISVVGRRPAEAESEEGAEGAATGATLGGVAGAGAGLLASLGLIAIPGIGPLVAAGVLATTVAGAATGAAAGGIVGALVDYGISKEEAPVYAESIRRGGTLVSVRAEETRADQAEQIMQRHEPIKIEERDRAYRDEGWQSFDPHAPSYSEEERQRERDRYRLHPLN